MVAVVAAAGWGWPRRTTAGSVLRGRCSGGDGGDGAIDGGVLERCSYLALLEVAVLVLLLLLLLLYSHKHKRESEKAVTFQSPQAQQGIAGSPASDIRGGAGRGGAGGVRRAAFAHRRVRVHHAEGGGGSGLTVVVVVVNRGAGVHLAQL